MRGQEMSVRIVNLKPHLIMIWKIISTWSITVKGFFSCKLSNFDSGHGRELTTHKVENIHGIRTRNGTIKELGTFKYHMYGTNKAENMDEQGI